ncbi:MAG: hypothetical protein LCH63_19150 [Candidatus Melainabacteria bacterium]|nr:hypothetical protein [Candidatus Melainabacteria bacterium]
MPLADAFNSRQSGTLTLNKMNSVPTTEDLKYALTEASRPAQGNIRVVELPFVNPLNQGGTVFMVAVSPASGVIPPRWTFYRLEGDSKVKLWTRETSEIIMIQGRIKVESLYQRTGDTVQNLPIVDSLQLEQAEENLESVSCPESPSLSQTGQFSRLDMARPESSLAQSSSQSCLPLASDSCAVSQSEASSAPFDVFAAQWKNATVLPEPMEIDRQKVNQLLEHLREDECELLSYQGFCLFLLAWCAPRAGSQAPLSLIYVRVRHRNQVPALEHLQAVAKSLKRLCAPYDVLAYFGQGNFGLMRYCLDGQGAMNVARAVSDVIEASPLLPPEVSLKVNIGIAVLPQQNGSEPGTALAAARAACELADKSGLAALVYPE